MSGAIRPRKNKPKGKRKMKLKLCFLTPDQEKALEENTKYTAHDRDSLGLLVSGIFDLVHILEIYTLDAQEDDIPDDNYLKMFQLLGRLIEPVQKYFADIAGETK
jgi:hypothetical protein